MKLSLNSWEIMKLSGNSCKSHEIQKLLRNYQEIQCKFSSEFQEILQKLLDNYEIVYAVLENSLGIIILL